MIELVFKLLSSGLSLWETKEKTKYVDRLIRLRMEYYAEINKPIHDNARIDNIEHELIVLCDSFTNSVSGK